MTTTGLEVIVTSNMSKNVTIGIVVVLVLLTGFYFYKSQKNTANVSTPTPQVTPTENPSSASPSASPSQTMGNNVVKITSDGFNPKNITIKVGDTVTWMNDDSADHTVNSAVHPTHTVYPPLNLGLIKPGEQKSLAFPTAGTYKYHDHLNPSLNGSVTVQ